MIRSLATLCKDFNYCLNWTENFLNYGDLTIYADEKVANLVQNFSVSGDFISQKRNGTGNDVRQEAAQD